MTIQFGEYSRGPKVAKSDGAEHDHAFTANSFVLGNHHWWIKRRTGDPYQLR